TLFFTRLVRNSSSNRQAPTFNGYADDWMKSYARVECKTSTADGYEGVLRQYLRPRFGQKRINEITRNDVKAMINDLMAKELFDIFSVCWQEPG
ncbi:MAG TPA: hypothetical protein VJQ82_25150, partial [Terriglobales bacterium]|nr:hypothetical protein [Terriglobales bacterium]